MQEFGIGMAVVSGLVLAALVFRAVGERARIPAPLVFLLAAAVASDLYEPLRTALSPRDVTWIASGALVVILFNGGVSLGWNQVRPLVGAVSALGFGATVFTAGALALSAHALLGFTWSTAAIVGVALAPTDPAVMFSVLGEGRLASRPTSILEAESGANDPIAIALMVGVLAAVLHGESWLPTITTTLVRELAVGLVIGIAGAWLARRPLTSLTRPQETLQPIVALAAAGLIFGTATALHASGFLSVFIAGLLLGDADPVGEDVRAFHSELAGLAEVIVFVTLGLTINLAEIGASDVLDGLALTALLLTIARPPAAMALLVPFDIPFGERAFVIWAGMRGAVPILLASLALSQGVADGQRIYDLVFIVVASSVLIQGIPLRRIASALGVDS